MSCTPSLSEEPAVSHLSLGGVLSDIEPYLPESLFGEECRRQMRRVADSLPVRLSSFWGFECRLGEPELSSDILFEIKKETSGPDLLAGEPPSDLDGLCASHPAWGKFRSLARDWATPGHPWNRDIRNLWLEMDLARSDAESVLRRPNIFFGPTVNTPNERICSLISELMPLFERPASQARAMREFFDCMPGKAGIFQIGFMLDRPDDDGMRLCVDKVEPEEIMPWFAKLWPSMGPDEAESLKCVFETVLPLCRSFNFGFNLTYDGADGAFGVECYEDWLDEDPAQWRPLLGELARLGLCLPEKAQGVMDYAGITALPLSKRIASGVIYLNTYRKIHHLKLTVSRGTLTQAKAYLAVSRPGLPLDMFGMVRMASGVSSDADRAAGQSWSIQ
ncbi:MAG: hypothetical protein LBQ56_05455 [Synergistaceae bacterium]|jgi:hypothetical protein|nr:hypothetical protein [Synergistaceae bacterium]